jgi:carbamoyl-phosphate synthase large subunit
LELNPRFGGGYPFSHEAGVNLPKAILAWVGGNEIPQDGLIPRIGEIYSKCDILIPIKHSQYH